MSLAVLDSEPISSRWWVLRTCSGLSSGPTSSVRSGYADQHDQPERDRGLQQDDRHDHERHDRAGEPGTDVHQVAEVLEVRRPDRDDLTRRHLARQGAAQGHRLAADELDGAVGRGQPVGDGVAVPDDAGRRLDEPDREHQPGVLQQLLGVLRRHAFVDRATDHGRQHGLRAHPGDAEQHPQQQGVPLPLRQPPQQPPRRPVVGDAGMVEGEVAHRLTLRSGGLSARPIFPVRSGLLSRVSGQG